MDKSLMQFRLTARTDVGKVREHNEDNYIVCPNLENSDWFLSNEITELGQKGSLLVIADGMGGLNAGEVASTIAIETIKDYFVKNVKENVLDHSNIKPVLFEAIAEAQANMIKHAKGLPETRGMGTTMVMALIKDNILHIAWVGDSRCYVFRNKKELFFATKDHSYVQELIDGGKLSSDQAFYHPENNIITRSLGDEPANESNPDFCSFPLQQEDRILLCSDGLNGMLQDKEIAAILYEEADITSCANKLISQANLAGGTDNITIILFDVISLTITNYNTDIKLYNLEPAAKYQPLQSDVNPFTTLKPATTVKEDSLPIRKQRTFKKT